MNHNLMLLFSFLLCFFVSLVYSHAGLTQPPARNVVGSVGWGDCTGLYCKTDYNWMGKNKGPHSGPWGDDTNICGDVDYIQPSPKPVATYTAGGDIEITISINAAHDGYYEFRLCVPDQVNQMPPSTNSAVRRCVEAGPMLKRKVPLRNGEIATYQGAAGTYTWTQFQRETRWRQKPEDGRKVANIRDTPSYQLTYVIPSNVQCEHCILHWYWQALNTWQTQAANTLASTEGERFWNCADIAINNPSAKSRGITRGIVDGSSNSAPSNPPPSNPPPFNPPSNPTPRPPSNPPPSNPTPRPPSNPPPFNPTPRPSGSGGGCSQVKLGSPPSQYWIAVIAPGASSLSIRCSGSSTLRQCEWNNGWGRFMCNLNGPGHCKSQKAVFGGSECDLPAPASATETDGLDETPSETEDVSDDTNDNDDVGDEVATSIPGWAIGLIVVGSISLFTLFVVLFMVLRSDKVESV